MVYELYLKKKRLLKNNGRYGGWKIHQVGTGGPEKEEPTVLWGWSEEVSQKNPLLRGVLKEQMGLEKGQGILGKGYHTQSHGGLRELRSSLIWPDLGYMGAWEDERGGG